MHGLHDSLFDDEHETRARMGVRPSRPNGGNGRKHSHNPRTNSLNGNSGHIEAIDGNETLFVPAAKHLREAVAQVDTPTDQPIA